MQFYYFFYKCCNSAIFYFRHLGFHLKSFFCLFACARPWMDYFGINNSWFCSHTTQVMLIKLNNYVVQLIRFTSVLARHGSRKIFLLLNNSSHDAHFSTCQNMETEDFLEKKSNFLSTGFPDIWLQTWLSRKLFWLLFFFFFLLPGRGLCVLHAITSRRYWAIGTKFRRHAQGWM